jgi:hypothetical protein
MNETPINNSVTPADVAEALKRAGYRAHLADTPSGTQIQSAAQGIGFFVAFGNAMAADNARYADFSFHCWITIQGELQPALIDTWNQSKRFARLFRRNQLLVLSQDVLVAGGVTDANLQAQIEIWDRVIQDFLQHLKRPVAASTASTGGGAA